MLPLSELNTEEWRDRLIYPIGIDDHGAYFPLFSGDSPEGESSRTIARVMHHQSRIHLISGDYAEADHALRKAVQISRNSSDYVTHGSILLTVSDLQVVL